MAFEATRKEWSEIYAFFRLLADGYVYSGTPEGTRDEGKRNMIAMIQREEHDGTRRYYIRGENIQIVGDQIEKTVLREDFKIIADLIFNALKTSKEEEITSPDGVEAFLDEIAIFDLEAKTMDRIDFSIRFWHSDAPAIGFCVRSRMGKMTYLLDGGRTANLKFELSGIKFATPTVNKVNALDTPNEVADRMMLIERLGGILKYSDVADRVFRSNLLMIDLHFPRLLAEMLRSMHLDGVNKVCELTEMMKTMNPLKIKEELIVKHGFYESKMKQFLSALALGMRPAKIYTGIDSAIEGFLMLNGNGDIFSYNKSDRETFDNFLFLNTRFEKSSTEKDKYGFLERENGIYYFKLNAKIGLLKR